MAILLLQGCTTDPHIEDWNRDRITEIPTEEISVSVCFDMDQHSKNMVYEMAREECSKRIAEVQTLVQHRNLQNARSQTTGEGQAFEGPIKRQKRIAAMIKTLSLTYVENDKWDCPLMTPNRINYECKYNPNATDSYTRKQTNVDNQPIADFPPELPDDLKPQ